MRRLVLLAFAACTSQTPIATGELDAWQMGPQLPVARANHCAVAIDNWLLVIGGNHADGMGGFVTTDEIDAAQISGDGTLGDWQVAGHLPSAASEPTCTTDGRTLLVVDAIYDHDTDSGQVWSSPLDSTGHFGAFASTGKLPEGVVAIASGAHVANHTLVVTHSKLPTDGDTTELLSTPLTGSPSWTSSDWKIGFHADYETAFTSKFAYVLGGYHDPSVGALADTYVAPLGGGAVVPTTPLPAPVAFGSAVVVDNWLFVTGGRAQVFGAPGTTNVYAAPIAADGSLGLWQTTSALSVARTNHTLTLVGDYVVITGGAMSGPGDSTVLLARAR
jgi:hypothetical protein